MGPIQDNTNCNGTDYATSNEQSSEEAGIIGGISSRLNQLFQNRR
jgi:hypothetical protein